MAVVHRVARAVSSRLLCSEVLAGRESRLRELVHTEIAGESEGVWGVVLGGKIALRTPRGTTEMTEGMYFGMQGGEGVHVDATAGRAVLVEDESEPLNTFGGPLERKGRLKYINGATDTALIPPPVAGMPCLNGLWFPQGVDQQLHTHPSARFAVLLSGTLALTTPGGTHDIMPGSVIYLPKDTPHAFHTPTSPATLIAFHPDSDSGPTHASHPMINRTFVQGVPVLQVQPEIQTKDI
eukprot:TRINITY_DN20204_c0_g1_i1.p1 TRINITY_DN20204_c0_g1~~TRINITY_DN20204_c0_g1_i1.p1  ORF type:complete len:238 (+),score=60.68 TRINITY_DN20204_c0_g1_i1:40-753(+)